MYITLYIKSLQNVPYQYENLFKIQRFDAVGWATGKGLHP